MATTAGFASRTRISSLLVEGALDEYLGRVLTVCGWSKSLRSQGSGRFCFIALNDGSTVKNLQIVVDGGIPGFPDIAKKAGVGASLRVVGRIDTSSGVGQSLELKVDDPETHFCEILGTSSPASYPLAKKQHSREYLREVAHLRPRSYFIGAVSRVRSKLAFAVHRFFYEKGFLYVTTPLITASDCEGAGEMFQVTTLLKDKKTPPNFNNDFFGKPAFLTVSGQLSVESFACSLADVYTFGPTFRAENSHTARHLAEFWMIEPEIAFASLKDDMDCAEECLKYLINFALRECRSDIEFFEKTNDPELIKKLEKMVSEPFKRLTYTQAVEQHLIPNQSLFKEEVYWGVDLATEHERYLAEVVYEGIPVIVYDYPKSIKPFYMRQSDDGLTVGAMDILVGGIGEIVGGSAREERLEKLEEAITSKGLKKEDYWWYRDLRKYGTVPHAGFGLGFERLIMLLCAIENIRDVIPFPRFPGHADF